MRLFVSVDLDGFEESIATLQKPLSELPGLRVTDPDDAHVTVRFLGGGDHDLDALREAVETAVDDADCGPFEVTFEDLGAFPSAERIRVVWLGVGQGADALGTLRDRTVDETVTLGYKRGRREFTPHVTLARMDHAESEEAVRRFLTETTPEIDVFHVNELHLKESRPTEEGPTYRTIERFKL